MMRTYEGAFHSVVAFDLRGGAAGFLHSGIHFEDAPPEDVIFEIGSITKVFTGVLLCLLIEEGTVDPCAPLAEMSEDLADVPTELTPEGLISHTSGLPNIHMPIWRAAITPMPQGPYAGFARADLLRWLRTWKAKPDPAPRHAYSNLGVGLLGEAMAMQAGRPFIALLTEKVIAPLGLADTTDRLDEDQQRRFARPKDTSGRLVSPWTFDALAAAGCLRSSGRDLARFSDRVMQALAAPETALDRAVGRSTVPIFGLGKRGAMVPAAQCSGWMSSRPSPTSPGILHASGGTAGSTCALYICPERHEACAILSNNGIAASLWGSIRLSWSGQVRQAHAYFGTG
ncbi:serine hydrolase [Dinoroseobacter sp. PD6]|uniref:serine hydrolase domain-containing protein n=1 Tax=Dinoroseobacter sp. PD6 TaxID=3028384 RepID=UPI00237BCD50|nr:serine hydrolase domain-containing protein [Dinoroseobacter sp. PD6]MDD9718662.1 serine hydrolase [Dinoroseobacter sp. PD6]